MPHVHTTPDEFEKTALFYSILRLGLSSTLLRHEKEVFDNALQTGGSWKCRLSVLVWTENILKTVGTFYSTKNSEIFETETNDTRNVYEIFSQLPVLNAKSR